MTNIASLQQLNYVFSSIKLNLTQAKEGVKVFLKNNAEEIFEANPGVFTSMNKADGTGKIQDWEDLYDLANSSIENNPLFGFVTLNPN